MPVDVSAYESREKTEGQAGLMDDLLAAATALNPDANASDLQDFVDAVAEAIGRAIQHVEDNL